MKSIRLFRQPWIVVLLLLGWPSIALAHVGVGSTNGLISGVLHPITGLDHLCAMVGVGLWAAQRGGKALWLAPLAFLIVMTLGGILGAAAVAIPFVEQGIVASVLILGILIAASIRLPLVAGILMVGTFALFHGHAHGAEMSLTASGIDYFLGFLATTTLLIGSGIAIGRLANRSEWPSKWRYVGAAYILCGVCAVLL